MFDTLRTEVGEATFRLKYRWDWSQTTPLAQAIAGNIYPKLKNVGFIVPMPASTPRARQPVVEVSEALGAIVKVPVFSNLLHKAKGSPLKNLHTKEEKIEAIGTSFSVDDAIQGDGPWNVLLIDDLFDTGASMEAACKALRGYNKVSRIYVAALTWK
jgi:predicted amidophosphoribosyltransferase